MRINIINDEKNFRFLFIELQFPRIGIVKRFNEWSDDYYEGFKADFPTEIYYLTDKKEYSHFSLTLLGFGLKLVNQNGY